MKTSLMTLTALGALLLWGCSKSEPADSGSQGQYIRATAELEGSTATKGILTGNTPITGMTFVHRQDVLGGLDQIDFTGSAPISGSRAADGKVTFSPEQQYNLANDKTSYFMGYTTAGGTLTGSLFTWTVDGANDILVTSFWNAGRYSAPQSSGMIFRHQLSRIEVICQAESGSALPVVQTMWGNIESVKFVGAMPKLTFDYATGAVASAGTAADFTLLNGDGYTTGAFAAVAIPANGSTAVTASAMLAPVASATISLKVKTVNLEEKSVPITLSGNFDRAKFHRVTLTFKANGKDIEVSSSTIEGWSNGATGGNDVTEPTT